MLRLIPCFLLVILMSSHVRAQEVSYGIFSELSLKKVEKRLRKMKLPEYHIEQKEGGTQLKFTVVKLKYSTGRIVTGEWRLELVAEEGGCRISGFYDEIKVYREDDGSISLLPFDSFEAFVDSLR